MSVCVGCKQRPQDIGVAGIGWVDNHDAAVARARSERRPMLLEFTADWCIPCKELERLTYPHALVRAQAKRFVMVRLDATDPDQEIERLFERYRVFGLPTILFFDSNGELLATPRVTGFEPPERFAALMAEVR